MKTGRSCAAIALIGIALTAGAAAADKPHGTTATRPPAPLDTRAMNAMLRADTDKDGVLSRDELERYDLSLARRFKDADADADGKLTFYEFEKLLEPAETSAGR